MPLVLRFDFGVRARSHSREVLSPTFRLYFVQLREQRHAIRLPVTSVREVLTSRCLKNSLGIVNIYWVGLTGVPDVEILDRDLAIEMRRLGI